MPVEKLSVGLKPSGFFTKNRKSLRSAQRRYH
jgi:hypothetical protein